jgi:hypothetical protein
MLDKSSRVGFPEILYSKVLKFQQEEAAILPNPLTINVEIAASFPNHENITLL